MKNTCYNRKGRVESTSPPLGRCSKCLITQYMTKGSDQAFAKLLVEAAQGRKMILHAYGNLLEMARVPKFNV